MALVLAERRPLQHTSSVLGRVQVPRVPRQEKLDPEVLGSVKYQRRNDEENYLQSRRWGLQGIWFRATSSADCFLFVPMHMVAIGSTWGPAFTSKRNDPKVEFSVDDWIVSSTDTIRFTTAALLMRIC